MGKPQTIINDDESETYGQKGGSRGRKNSKKKHPVASLVASEFSPNDSTQDDFILDDFFQRDFERMRSALMT
jgi:hypothetical protein